MNPTPARGPQGPGPSFRRLARRAAGLTVYELAVSILFASMLSLVIAPGTFALRESVSIRNAVHETTVAFYLARSYAISRNRNVGLKFRRNGDRYEWALYGDGNGNGVRTAEIASGVDRFLGIAYPWSRNDIRPAIMTGIRVPDPSTPGRYLDRIDDPIRFNNSDICSFTPLGDATPGSVYLWDAHHRMAVVRVFGATAKIRTLYYRRGARGWTP